MLVQRGGVWWDGDFALLTCDDATRTAVWVRFDGDGGMTLRTDQYGVEAAIEPNAEFEKSTHGKKFGDWNRIASVPNILAEQHNIDEMLRQGDNKALSRFFNDPENAKLRTSRGRV
jgi:hypothetical protein